MSRLSLNGILSEISQQLERAYPGGKALILTGSAAREETSVIETSSATIWLSDLEAFVVIDDASDFAQERSKLDRLSRQISGSLQTSAALDISVELTPTPERYFSSLRPQIFGYELRTHGRQVFGSRAYLKEIPNFPWQDIPLRDAWTLVSNRMVEWLDHLVTGGSGSIEKQFYVLTKLYVDFVTSLSMFSGHYEPTYRGRAANTGAMLEWLSVEGLDLRGTRFAKAAEIAFTFKLDPQPIYESLRQTGSGNLREALQTLNWTWLHDDLPGFLSKIWTWQLGRLSGAAVQGRNDIFPAIRRIYSRTHHIGGWVRLAQRSHYRTGGKFFMRAARLWPLGPPRGLVYACANALLGPQSTEDLHWIHGHLPVLYGPSDRTWRGLASQCLRNWRMYLRREYL